VSVRICFQFFLYPYRGHGARKQKAQNFFTVQFFVRLNGGDIYLAPSEDGTTTFCIEMPEAFDQVVSS